MDEVAGDLAGAIIGPRLGDGRAGEGAQAFGQGGKSVLPFQRIERLVEILQQRAEEGGQLRIDALAGLDEGQGPPVQRRLQLVRPQGQGAIAEGRVGAGAAVMQFVRMQDEELAWLGMPRFAAIIDALHPAQGDAQRIDVMPVRREGAAVHERFEPPVRSGGDAG
jgi:hypothetical protein